ncbi:T9SS type A sorting domain-containing protein [Winogradskyella thalassocola]|uniref:Por secretion system C-terminal sorting domain-containing protein n=1 Tax=Winogradskyella thalassocola TaxID=262004 RepID=A0A1G7VVY2_9FLAO|nr:T9SS type A sorting domain-containing protein [Winogradskyella thalassocola]SDG63944.1 Por secretion system C-terminal sorting domain-containing protein [Winogradskyella thalassocola]
MKTKLLFTQQTKPFYFLLVFSLCFNYGWSQNLMLNPTCDDHTSSTSDNADAYDMTPNSEIEDESGANITSPYRAIWNNSALEDALEIKYLGMEGSLDEQPGSTSSGNNGTRGVKLYDDGNPSITGSSRRIYQKVEGLTIGANYIFSVDSRSEASGTDSEVYILNTEITDEVGIDANGSADASIDAYMDIAAADEWATFTTVSFTATNTFAVVYIRSLGSIDGDTEVFYDNFSLAADPTASVNDVLAAKIIVYPNPAKNFLAIEAGNVDITSVSVFNILGAKVLEQKELVENKLNVSSLKSGIYLLKISGDNAVTTKRFIVE